MAKTTETTFLKIVLSILTIVAVFTFPLISNIGGRITNGIDIVAAQQLLMIEEQGKINGAVSTLESEAKRNKEDISELDKKFTLKDKEINIRVDGISKRLYKVEGAK